MNVNARMPTEECTNVLKGKMERAQQIYKKKKKKEKKNVRQT